MISKRILVLANSTKHHPMRCVAGRELIAEETGKSPWGSWIRPVSNHDEGALDVSERRLEQAADPKPLDVVHLQKTILRLCFDGSVDRPEILS
jgi:hypothetical protein